MIQKETYLLTDKYKSYRLKIAQKINNSYCLVYIFILAICVRSLMPAYLISTNEPWQRFMLASSYAYDMLSLSVSIAKGEGLHLEYREYIVNDLKLKSLELNKIPKYTTNRPLFLDKGGIGQILISAGLTFLLNHVNVIAIQIVQGIIDSLGTLVVYGIVSLYFSRLTALLGALIYALWPPSVFFSYHLMGEAFIPIMMLSIGYASILALKKKNWYCYCTTGALIGLSFSFRSDNLFILPFYIGYIIWIHRGKLIHSIKMASLVLIFCILSMASIKMVTGEKTQDVSNVGVALYNSLGEYPSYFRGIRFFSDESTLKYGIEKSREYLKNDRIFQIMYKIAINDLFPGFFKPMTDYHLITLLYIREVIIGKPFLYADRLISRFIAYLPSNPFIACIVYFFTHNPNGNQTMIGYRYSQLFHLAKYIDYFLFILFIYGVWASKQEKAMLSILCIYLGVLVGHVIIGVGEVYFRNDTEYAYLDPRYLLGMVSIWPVFLSIAIGKIMLTTSNTGSRLWKNHSGIQTSVLTMPTNVTSQHLRN